MNSSIMKCNHQIASFLERTGLLGGRIPSLDGAPWFCDEFQALVVDGIALVRHPAHAIMMSIFGAGVAGGVCVGRAHGLATLPDLLLGYVDRVGAWHWGGGEYGLVVNLHHPTRVNFPCDTVWPVWFTFGDYQGDRENVVRSGQLLYDLSENLRKLRCEAFWGVAKEEFIRETWAPSRLPWCLDVDEYREIFSAQ